MDLPNLRFGKALDADQRLETAKAVAREGVVRYFADFHRNTTSDLSGVVTRLGLGPGQEGVCVHLFPRDPFP
jgi:hypothetical protein